VNAIRITLSTGHTKKSVATVISGASQLVCAGSDHVRCSV
jgi:hypothetical protein